MPTAEQLLKQIDRLRSTLLKSSIQQTNQPLFQVINTLIGVFREALTGISGQVTDLNGLPSQDYLTWDDNTAVLPNSRELIAGQNVDFDDSVANQRSISVPLEQEFLTAADETGSLPNSRQLLAGTGISFDDSVANERTINSTAIDREWSVLTNGNELNPELIFADGDVIMVSIP